MSSYEIEELILAVICVAPFAMVSVFALWAIRSAEYPEK